MSRTIGLSPQPHGADLTIDGTTFATITLVGSGAEVALPPVADPDVKVVRTSPAASGSAGVNDADPSTLRVAASGLPDLAIPRSVPCTDAAAATPSGLGPIRGQDNLMYEVAWSMFHSVNTLILGPTGCGKTHSVRLMCQLLGLPFVMASIDPDVTKGDLIGEAVVPPSATGNEFPLEWQAGPVEVACRMSQHRKTVLCLDEVNRAAKTSVFASMYPVLDGSKVLTLPGGEQIPVGDLVVFATANPADDAKTSYEVRELDPALADRFGSTCTVRYPDPSVESMALCEQIVGLDADVALRLCETAKAVRDSDAVAYPFGFRTLAAWGHKVATGFDPVTAAESTFVPKAPPEDREAIRTFIQMHHTR